MEKVKPQTRFQEYQIMSSTCSVNTYVTMQTNFNSQHFSVFGTGVQRQNVILEETNESQPRSLPSENQVMCKTLPTPVGLKPSCRSTSLESCSKIQVLSTSKEYCLVSVLTPGICIEYISWVILMYHLLGITKLQF